MEEFELRALQSFSDVSLEVSAPSSEFTHDQHQLHGHFLDLFEELVEGFLRKENYSVEDFYKQLSQYLDADKINCAGSIVSYPSGAKATHRLQDEDFLDDDSVGSLHSETDSANEVFDVIRKYMRFDLWAENMRQMARQQLRFRSFREQVGSAVRLDYQQSKYTPGNLSTAHRLNDCTK